MHRTSLAVLAALVFAATSCTPRERARLPDAASPVAQRYALECDEGVAASCYALGLMYRMGDDGYHGVPSDLAHANELVERACAGGHAAACSDGSGSGAVAPDDGSGID